MYYDHSTEFTVTTVKCGNYDPAVPNIRVWFQNDTPESQTCTGVD